MDAAEGIALPGTTVTLRYTIRLDDGTSYPPPSASDVLRFAFGRDRILPGLERALSGLKPGDLRRVRIPAADAYGPRLPEKTFRIARPKGPAGRGTLRIGDAVRVACAGDADVVAIVEAVDATSVLVDANHPLCGQDLTFDLEVLDVVSSSLNPVLVA